MSRLNLSLWARLARCARAGVRPRGNLKFKVQVEGGGLARGGPSRSHQGTSVANVPRTLRLGVAQQASIPPRAAQGGSSESGPRLAVSPSQEPNLG